MKVSGRYAAISAALAFFTCYCLSSGYILTEPLWVDSGSVLNLFIFAGLSLLYYKAFFPFDRRRFCLSLFFGFLMGFMILLGAGYVRDVQMVLSLGAFTSVVAAAALMFAAFLNLLFQLHFSDCTIDLPYKYFKLRGLKLYLLLFLLNGLILSVTFLAVYPGIYSYDASVQVLQFFGDKPVTTHHPVLHTLFLCGSLKAGQVLFGSFQAGMVIHSVVQAALLNAVFSYMLWRMFRERRSALLVIFSFLFLIVNPYIQILLFTTTKDVLFGAAFLLLFLFAADLFRDTGAFFQSRWLQLRFLLMALLLCFLRNQGIYVLLFFGVITLGYLFFVSRSRAVRWLLILAVSTGCYFVVTGPIFASLGVERGDSREMLSVPMQQLARAYHEVPEQLTEEERSYIRELIPEDYLELYVSVNADPVKSGFQTEVMNKDPIKFFKTWFTIGLKTPLVYADSFFMGNWGYWYPEETQYWINYIVFDGAFMEEEYNVLHITRDSRFPEYEEFLRDISLTPAFEDIPVLSVILNQAFPFWLMLTAAAVILYHKKYRLLIPLTLILGYWGTLLLGPVTSVRYAFPLMICVPAMLSLLADASKKTS